MLDQMVEESACMRSIGGLKSDEGRKQFMDRLTLQDVQGAVGFRRLQATQRATKTLGARGARSGRRVRSSTSGCCSSRRHSPGSPSRRRR